MWSVLLLVNLSHLENKIYADHATTLYNYHRADIVRKPLLCWSQRRWLRWWDNYGSRYHSLSEGRMRLVILLNITNVLREKETYPSGLKLRKKRGSRDEGWGVDTKVWHEWVWGCRMKGPDTDADEPKREPILDPSEPRDHNSKSHR